MKTLSFIAALFLVSGVSNASIRNEDEHVLGSVKGPEIELKEYDHAVAGSIHGIVMWGAVDEAKGQSELILRKDGQLIRTTFKKQDGKLGGVTLHSVDDKNIKTELYFKKVDFAKRTLTYSLNGVDVVLEITSQSFEENHFIRPTYRATFQGKTIEYTLDGRACMNYSAHLGLIMLSAYFH